MIFDSQIEKILVEIGFDNMSMSTKNELITTLAGRNGLLYSQITDEYILRHHKQLKIDMMSEKCDEVIITGFTASNGHVYRLNRDDQINFIGQAQELLFFEKDLDVIPWKTEDDGYINHTREEWLKVYREGLSHKKSQLFKYDTLKEKILSAKTHSEIVNATW